MTADMPEERFLTPEEVADMLRVSPRTVNRWLNQGKLPGVKIGSRWRIEREDFERFIQESKGSPESS